MFYNVQVRNWPVGQAVKTLASHAGIRGSIPLRVIQDGEKTPFDNQKKMEVSLC